MQNKVKIIRAPLKFEAVRCGCLSTPVSCLNPIIKEYIHL